MLLCLLNNWNVLAFLTGQYAGSFFAKFTCLSNSLILTSEYFQSPGMLRVVGLLVRNLNDYLQPIKREAV